MQNYHLNDILISEARIRMRIDQLVEEMAETFQPNNVVMIGILRGSFMFLADLVRKLYQRNLHPRIDFLTLESYGGGTESIGYVRVARDFSVDVRGADVLLVDDIFDSGRTLYFATKHVENRGANSIRTCALLNKPARRIVQMDIDYVGFTIPDEFVVGYGLDYDSRHRELPHIAKVTYT